MKSWALIVALIIALAVGLCRLAPPVSAVELSEPIPGSMQAYDFGDSSMLGDASAVSSSIDHDPDAPPREDESAEGGQDSSESDYWTMGEEAIVQEDESAEGGQDVEEDDSSLMGEEASAQEEEPAEGGQDVEEATETDLASIADRLDSINSLFVFLLGSVWAIAGMFFAFKLGGALL